MVSIRFVADVMLGSLAKWLRVLGYDTHYQPSYPPGAIEVLIKEGRVLLTRHRRRAAQSGQHAVLIHGNHVAGQLMELAKARHLSPPAAAWFSRCLLCNAPLRQAHESVAREHVPDYVFHQNVPHIHVCPSCGKYFWPGSHRTNMELQLRAWGFSPTPGSPDSHRKPLPAHSDGKNLTRPSP